jgi:hypothetical protein
MAIIYSYPNQVTPVATDLLLGTNLNGKDNETRNFTIQSIIDLVNPSVPGGGTVTNILTTGDTFVSLTGGPITTTGTITAGLTAGGAPSATTFLRGDNTWATVASDNTTYVLRSTQSGINANLLLTGSDLLQTIVSLQPGPYITLTDDGFNGVEISAANVPLGTVTSVEPGKGLAIETGVAEVNPELQVEPNGPNNYIRVFETPTVPTQTDYIPFNQAATGNVKSTTFSTIPISAVDLIKTYIDAGDDGDVRNNTDTFTTTGVVQQVVSLTSAEYTALATKDPNTLYVVIASNPSFTVTQTLVNNIAGGTAGVDYVLSGPANGATQAGVAGTPYAFTVTASPASGKYFSSAFAATNPSGTISADATVTNTLTGTIAAVPAGTCTATPVITNNTGSTNVTVAVTPNPSSGTCPHAYTFTATATASSGFAFTSGPLFNGSASGTITGTATGNQNIPISVTGTVAATAAPQCTVTLNVDTSFVTGTEFTLSGDTTGSTRSGNCGDGYAFATQAIANSGYEWATGPVISPANGNLANTTVTSTVTGVLQIVTPSTCVTTLAIQDNIINNSGVQPAVAYTIAGNLAGATDSGNCPNAYNFATTVTPNTGYQFTAAIGIINAQGTSTTSETVTTTITGTVEAIATNITITPNVITSGITGSSNFTVTTPAAVVGLPPQNYSFTPTIALDQDYVWTSGPTFNPALPATGNASANTTVDITVTGNIDYSPCYAIQLFYGVTACPTGNFQNWFTDVSSSSFCSATKLWLNQSDCGTTNYAPAGIYKTASGQQKSWGGSSFTSNCSNCP